MARVAAAGRRNWFAIGVSVGVVALLIGVGALVVLMNNAAGGPAAAPEGPTITEAGGIAIGDGPGDVELWLDFYCGHCQNFEDAYGPTLEELVDGGDITLTVVPVALSGLNAASGTDFSARSASATYCVAQDNPEAVHQFVIDVFALKPAGAGLSNDELSALAASAGAPGAASCIADETYKRFALSNAANLPPNPATGQAGTPTLLVGGEYVGVTGNIQADLLGRL